MQGAPGYFPERPFRQRRLRIVVGLGPFPRVRAIAVLYTLCSVTCACAQELRWESLREEVERLEQEGRYSEARARYVAALREAEKLGPESGAVAIMLDDLGSVANALGEYAGIERLYKRSILILEKVLGTEHRGTAVVRGHLAGLYMQTERLAQAEPLLHQSLAIHVRSLGPDHLDVAEILDEIGMLYTLQQKRADAESLFREALAIFEKHPASQDVRIAMVLSNLACAITDPVWAGEALSYAERSLQLLKKSPHPPTTILVKTLSTLGVLYSATDRVDEAEPYLRRALTVSETTFGPHHTVVAYILRSYAVALRRLKRKREANRMQRRADLIVSNSARDNGYGNTIDSAGFSRNDVGGSPATPLPFALKPPLIDVRPGTVFIPFLVDETKLILSGLGPRHPPVAVNSDHRHEAGKDDLFTCPASG
jgi:tetratricopeptide (TPR) repeat protein